MAGSAPRHEKALCRLAPRGAAGLGEPRRLGVADLNGSAGRLAPPGDVRRIAQWAVLSRFSFGNAGLGGGTRIASLEGNIAHAFDAPRAKC